MFGKSKSSSSAVITKDINESIKTLSYLARAEKYFDLELKKNGQTTKPLLKIVDIIEPLRKIGDATSKIGKGQKIADAEAKQVFATSQINQIIEVANDILALNPKGLVSSDKTALSKLEERLGQAAKLVGVNYQGRAAEETLQPKTRAGIEAAAQKAEEAQTASNENIEEESSNVTPINSQTSKEPIFTDDEDLSVEDIVRPGAPSAAGGFPQEELKKPLQWENRTPAAASQEFRKVTEEASQAQYPEPQQPARSSYEPQVESKVNWAAETPAPAPQPQIQPQSYSQPVQESRYEPVQEPVAQSNHSQNTQSQKVVPLNTNKARKETFNLPQKYFATSYSGMNLQEAAEIISELADNPANLEIVMLEHASRVRPIAEGKEIIGDLLALAPIADSFETGTEITDKKHLSVLKDAERIISVCKDIATVNVEGFDRRKQKLFDKFLPEDIRKTVEWAKIAYPEVFSTGDGRGDTVSETLLDLADILNAHSSKSSDKDFSDLLSQVVTQIVLYAEHTDLRLKFDIVTKKNKLNSNPQPLNSRSEVAVLRAITFVPKIARQAQDILLSDNLNPQERDIVNKSLDILQLAYLHARDNYSAEISSFYDNKAA